MNCNESNLMFVPLQMIKLTTRVIFFLFETLLRPVKNVKPTKILPRFLQ